MQLAALIAAYQDTGIPGMPLRATLPLAGRTVVERQARLAAAVGADPVVILVERVTADLAAAIDRLRSEGVSVEVARSAGEAAEAIDPQRRLLLVADGLVAEPGHYTRVAGSQGNAILTVPDDGADERHERIDADSRWAGLAIMDGRLLQDTAAMLQDWDLQSTLLRRAVQSGARQLAARGEADGLLLIADADEELAGADKRILAEAGGPGHGWASRWLLAPLERALTRALMPASVAPEWLYVAAAALTATSAFLFLRGWLLPGVLLLLLTTPLDGSAERLARVRLHAQRPPGWWDHVIPAAATAALLALGNALAEAHGWGCLLLAAVTILFLIALRGELHGREIAGDAWLAERKGMAWLMLPFAITGLWVPGLTALALYAAGSFFWAQREAHHIPPR